METTNNEAIRLVLDLHDEAVTKALDALAGYKFQMFGYWAATAVHYSQLIGKLGGKRPPSRFRGLVVRARELVALDTGTLEDLAPLLAPSAAELADLDAGAPAS